MAVDPQVKILQAQGLGSRKLCENILHHGIDLLNGQPFDPNTDRISFGDTVQIDGEDITLHEKVYLLLHKPAGYETSHKPAAHPSVFELLPHRYLERGVQAAGRLDVDTTGLLLMSDDGQFIHQVISGKKKEHLIVEKEYHVTTARPIDEHQTNQLLKGVMLHDENEPIHAIRADRVSDHELILVITTGKYHQVKRMIAATGNHVEKLHRHRVGDYTLPADLPEGEFIHITPDQ